MAPPGPARPYFRTLRVHLPQRLRSISRPKTGSIYWTQKRNHQVWKPTPGYSPYISKYKSIGTCGTLSFDVGDSVFGVDIWPLFLVRKWIGNFEKSGFLEDFHDCLWRRLPSGIGTIM